MLDRINNLIEDKRYADIKRLLSDMNEYDIAEIFEDLPYTEIIKLFRLLPKDIAADVFSYLETDTEAKIITSLSDKEAVDIINEMASDDATDLMDEMPANVVTKLLNKVDPDIRHNINQLLKYPDNSAGSIMTMEYLDFKEYNTVKDALKKIRHDYDDQETINICFVTDKRRQLIGTVTLKDLVINDENTPLSDIMDDDFVSVSTQTDQEDVAKLIRDYDITCVPVVDLEHKLVGIITIDDVIDIMEDETTEDIEKMAAILPTEKEYLKLSTWDIWKSRIPWLLLLMISATFTGQIIGNFENALAILPILTAYIPMLMDTGGNAGSQASVTIIRSLSVGDIEFKDINKVIWKELRVSIIVGATLAIANFAKLLLIDKMLLGNTEITYLIAAVICLTIFLIVIVAKFIGCTLPLLTKKLGFDPAVMASPFITTIVDALGLLVYFKIAMTLLNIG